MTKNTLHNLRSLHGFTLIEILIALSLLSVLSVIFLKFTQNSMQSLAYVKSRDDRSALALAVYNKIGCAETLKMALQGTNGNKFDPATCPALASSANSLNLNPIMLYRASSNGQPKPLTGPLQTGGPL